MKIEIVTCTISLVNGVRDLISSINPSKNNTIELKISIKNILC